MHIHIHIYTYTHTHIHTHTPPHTHIAPPTHTYTPTHKYTHIHPPPPPHTHSLEAKGGPPVSQGWKVARSLSRSSTSSGKDSFLILILLFNPLYPPPPPPPHTHKGSRSKVPLAGPLRKILSQPAIQSDHTPQSGPLTSRKLALLPKVTKAPLVQQQSLPVRFS